MFFFRSRTQCKYQLTDWLQFKFICFCLVFTQVKMISEVLTSIKLIKLYAWEESFARVIYGEGVYYIYKCIQYTFQVLTICYIIDFIVHISYHICQSTLHCSCFISFPQVHTSLIMFHFYFLQSTVHLIHFTYHSPSRSYLPYYLVIQPHCQFHFSANPVSGN